MNPNENKMQELERQVKELTDFMRSWENPALITPSTKLTIQTIVGALKLSDLSDVSDTDGASTGQVLKKTATTWQPGTDNT
jgi:hypothetical protein